MIGLVVNQLVPSLPLAICLTCVEVGVVTLVLKASLTSILLVTVVAGGNANSGRAHCCSERNGDNCGTGISSADGTARSKGS